METPATRYARAPDGAYLAYQVFGKGPTDLLHVSGWHSHLEVYWEQPLYASFMRRLVAGPSEVLVSSTVKDLVAGSGLVFEDRGERELKGIPEPWHLYAVALAAA